MQKPESKNVKPKTIVLIIGIVLMLVNVLLPDSVFVSDGLGRLITLAFTIAFNLITVFWCSYDSIERGEKLSSGLILLTVIFGIFALFYYLFKTRGFRSGLIAIGKLLLLFIGFVLVSTVIQIIREFV